MYSHTLHHIWKKDNLKLNRYIDKINKEWSEFSDPFASISIWSCNKVCSFQIQLFLKRKLQTKNILDLESRRKNQFTIRTGNAHILIMKAIIRVLWVRESIARLNCYFKSSAIEIRNQNIPGTLSIISIGLELYVSPKNEVKL